MAAPFLTIDVRGERRAVQGILGSLKDTERAHMRALRKTADKIMTDTAREIAAAQSLNIRPVRKRMKRFLQGVGHDARVKVWLGLKAAVRFHESAAVRARFKGKTFTIPKAGSKAFIRSPQAVRHSRGRPRTSSPNLPIIEPQIFIEQKQAEQALEAHTRAHVRQTYPKELKRLLELRGGQRTRRK